MRTATEQRCAASDGTELFYRHWPAVTAGGPRRGLVLFHRGHEHSGRLQAVVDGLDLPGYDMFAWDARGHGRSPGERGWAESFEVLVADADAFCRHLAAAYGIAPENLAVVAQSVGAVVAAAWLHDFAPKVRCAVLAVPAFRVKLYLPFAIPGLRLLQRFKDPAFIKSYVKAKLLTHDPERIASYQADPLISRAIAVNILVGLFDTSKRVIADAAAILTPTQVLVSGADWVVRKGPQREFFARLGATDKELHEFPGFFHDTLGEKDRRRALGKARDFIERRFAAPPAPPSLLDADRHGLRGRSSTASRRQLRRCPASPSGSRGGGSAASAGSPTASGSGSRPASTRAARSTMSTATGRPGRRRWDGCSTPPISAASAGAASGCAGATSKRCWPARSPASTPPGGRCAWSTSRLDTAAMSSACWRGAG